MDEESKFHQIALHSILFKGRYDWYFCYLKSEKIAHVISVLARSSNGKDLKDILHSATDVPHSILYFAAGDVSAQVLLADILSLVTALRFAATGGSISADNARVLIEEYEQIALKIAADNRPSPFVSPQDFALPAIEQKEPQPLLGERGEGVPTQSLRVKDIRDKGQKVTKHTQGQGERTSLILDLVRRNKGISIKDISTNVRNCSEKTIQRELVALISQGLVKKVGERRWSLYFPA
jgi:hypothetical protein